MQSRRLHVLFGLCLYSLTASLLSGCAGSESIDDDDVGTLGSDVTQSTRMGVDYSWARPSPAGLHAAGYTFAARYLAWDTQGSHGKLLTASEVSSLSQAGVDVVANWEFSADDALGGYNAGVQNATEALHQANAAGMPAGRPIYFSVDFDASESQQGTLNAYMDGAASVIGRDRVGAYGGYYVIKRLFDAHKITWGWQAYAWSGGQWDARAQVRQTHNGVTIAGGECDIDQAQVEDFGQWAHTGSSGGGNTGGGSTIAASTADHKLYCPNTQGAEMHASASSSSSVVNHLRTSPSWFDCWGTGELHAGGNTTWYHTLGDDNDNWGWVPGVDLDTASSFDADPSSHGLAQCTPPVPVDPACHVHSDGKLYCTNTTGAAMYASATSTSTTVNHLRTSPSWFSCWGTGQLHAGGNTTWYYTLGDDNGNWGWVPAVNLNTSSGFDANPTAQGLHKCGG